MSETILEVHGLTKKYGDLVAVDHLDFSVQNGEIFGFLGPNGAGKTTSIRMMCGLLRPDEGRVIIQNHNIYQNGNTVLNRIGICPQEIVIWKKLTCLEQLIFVAKMYGIPGGEARQRAVVLLERLGLIDKKDTFGKNLSGGMKRRLNLLLGLMNDPEILFLDEPEAGLDPQSRIVVRDFIHSLAENKLVILTTHNMDEAERLADHIAIIDHGKLLVTGTPGDLKKSVGEGDRLDFDMVDEPMEKVHKIIELLKALEVQSQVHDNRLILSHKNMMNKLPDVLKVIEGAGVKPADIHLRQSTLEDVFISLTGRGLRQ